MGWKTTMRRTGVRCLRSGGFSQCTNFTQRGRVRLIWQEIGPTITPVEKTESFVFSIVNVHKMLLTCKRGSCILSCRNNICGWCMIDRIIIISTVMLAFRFEMEGNVPRQRWKPELSLKTKRYGRNRSDVQSEKIDKILTFQQVGIFIPAYQQS